MEGIVNFGPNMASFFLMLELRRWYVGRAYVPPNDAPAAHSIEQALELAPKLMEVILLGDLNIRLREPRDNREDELPPTLAGNGLGDVTAHFTPRRWYIGTWELDVADETRR